MSESKRAGVLSKLAQPEAKENIEFTGVTIGATAALVAAGAVIAGAGAPIIAGAAITSVVALAGSKLAQPAIKAVNKAIETREAKKDNSTKQKENDMGDQGKSKHNEINFEKLQTSLNEKSADKSKSTDFVVRVGKDEHHCETQKQAIETFLEKSASAPEAKIEAINKNSGDVIAAKEPAASPRFENGDSKFLAEQVLNKNPDLLSKLVQNYSQAKDNSAMNKTSILIKTHGQQTERGLSENRRTQERGMSM